MKRLFLIAALALASTSANGVEREIPFSYDNAWQKAVRGFASEGIEFSVIDKDTGIIQGSSDFHQDPRYFKCPNVGASTSWSYNIAVTIQEKDDSSSIISITAKGLVKSYRNKHLLFIKTGTVDYETPCSSTGEMENLLLKEIFGLAPNYQYLIEQIESRSTEIRMTASRSIYDTGIQDAGVYEAIAMAIKEQSSLLGKQSPRSLQQEISWHALALSNSGNLDYMPLLDELSKSKARSVAKHAKKAKKILAKTASGD